MQKVRHTMQVAPSLTKDDTIWWHKTKINIFLKYRGYQVKFLPVAHSVADQPGGILWVDVKSLSNSIIGMPAVATLNVQLHGSKRLNTLIVKCFRLSVWETRHSDATGWELPSHFSDVWCSPSLQLTRNSDLQRESLFRYQMWRQ